MYLSYVLTMDVFTISWWIGNQPIVAIIFPCALLCFQTCYPTFGGVKPLLLHIVAYMVAYPWWGDAFMFILLLLYLLLSYSRA